MEKQRVFPDSIYKYTISSRPTYKPRAIIRIPTGFLVKMDRLRLKFLSIKEYERIDKRWGKFVFQDSKTFSSRESRNTFM